MNENLLKCVKCGVTLSMAIYIPVQQYICHDCAVLTHDSPHTHQEEPLSHPLVQQVALSGTSLSASPSSSPSPSLSPSPSPSPAADENEA